MILTGVASVTACPTLIINDSQRVVGLAGYDLGDTLSAADFFELVKANEDTGVSILFPSDSNLVDPQDVSFYVYTMQEDSIFSKTFQVTFNYCTSGHDQVVMQLSEIENGMLDEERFTVDAYEYEYVD